MKTQETKQGKTKVKKERYGAVGSSGYYKKKLKEALKKLDAWSDALDAQVTQLSYTMHAAYMANRDISSLETTYVTEESRYGSKIVPHPAFKVYRDMQGLAAKQIAQLWADAMRINGGDGPDAIDEFRQYIESVK